MNPFEMVVAIVVITSIASIARAKYGARDGGLSRRDLRRQSKLERKYGVLAEPVADPDADRMREEITALKERIQVLERVITDTNSASALDREIEKLR